MSLCERCEAIDLAQILAKSIPPDSKSIAKGWVHSQTFAQLRVSAGTCELCSILLGDANTKPLVRDDDCVYLLVFTRNSWPRIGSGSHPIPIGGIVVQIGNKGVNVLHSVRRVDIWIDDSAGENSTTQAVTVSCGRSAHTPSQAVPSF